PKTRAYAAEELGHVAEIRLSDAKPALGPLIAALKDRSPLVRKAVIEALPKLEPEPKQVVPGYTAIVEKEKDMGVRTAAIKALGQIGPPAKDAVKALQDLQKMIKSQKPPKGKDKAQKEQANKQLLQEIEMALRKIQGK